MMAVYAGLKAAPDTGENQGQQPAEWRQGDLLRYVTGLAKAYTPGRPWTDYLQSLGLVILVSLLGQSIRPFLDPANLVMLYLLVEVMAAVRFGLGPSIAAAVFSVVAFNFFFVPPRFTLTVEDAQYLLSFVGLLVVGLVISILTARLREEVREARRREAQTAASYDLSRSLAVALGFEATLQTIITYVREVFNREVIVLLPEEDELRLHTLVPDFGLDEHERAVAAWTFQNGQPAGPGTQTLAGSGLQYHPLKTARGVVGVLGIEPADAGGLLTPEQTRLLELFANQAAVAIERMQLAEQAHQSQLMLEAERLYAALLDSVSHDLRTPLASITGVLSSLRDDQGYLDPATRRDLVENAWGEADRMNRLVANLLDMTRLQAGAMRVTREPCDVQDLIGVALAELSDKFQKRPVAVSIPHDLPLVPLDFVLMAHVLVNLLDNAHKYSPEGAPIEIGARLVNGQLEIDVADRGLGIPEDKVTRVFEKFYRVQPPNGSSGTGLGLSICKGIVEAHGGRIWAHSRLGGGTIFTMSLPASQPEEAGLEEAL